MIDPRASIILLWLRWSEHIDKLIEMARLLKLQIDLIATIPALAVGLQDVLWMAPHDLGGTTGYKSIWWRGKVQREVSLGFQVLCILGQLTLEHDNINCSDLVRISLSIHQYSFAKRNYYCATPSNTADAPLISEVTDYSPCPRILSL